MMDGMQHWSEEVAQVIKKLENDIQNLERQKQEITKENQELREKIKALENRLAYYENPHTPPSARKLSEEKTSDAKKSNGMGRRGAPKGHRGATRLKPEPDETVDVVDEKCKRCGSHNIQDTNEKEQKTVEDFVPPKKKVKATRFVQHKMKCMNCGYEWLSQHPDCPKKGDFGVYLLVYITILKFHLRGVLQRSRISSSTTIVLTSA